MCNVGDQYITVNSNPIPSVIIPSNGVFVVVDCSSLMFSPNIFLTSVLFGIDISAELKSIDGNVARSIGTPISEIANAPNKDTKTAYTPEISMPDFSSRYNPPLWRLMHQQAQ